MNDWFEFNGIRCTQYLMHVSEQPPITIPKERSTTVTVPGRPGTLTLMDGDAVYDDLNLTAKCFVENTTYIKDIGAWLRGTGEVMFANRPEGYYKACVMAQIPFDTVFRGRPYRTTSVQFRCNPMMYLASGRTPVTFNKGSALNLNNPTVFPAYPTIKVKGTGSDIYIMVGEYTIEIDNLSDNLTLDCETLTAYKTLSDGSIESAGKCVRLINDCRPQLIAGSNPVNWDSSGSGVTSVTVTPNWRSL